LLSRIGKKKKKRGIPPAPAPQQQPKPQSQPVATQPQSSTPQQEEEQEAPLSFEDILRELSGEGRKKRQQPVEPEPEPVRIPPPPMKKPLVSEPAAQTPEDTNRSMDKRNTDAADLWGAYKNETKEVDRNTEAADLWGAYKEGRKKEHKLTAAEQKDKEEHRSIKFDEYNVVATENPLTSQIRDMLEDPEDVRKAIVLAEILQRKY
jgi:hypothetical protein